MESHPHGSATGEVIGVHGRVTARTTTRTDLEFVVAAEAHPAISPFVLAWPRSRHAAALEDPGSAHWTLTAAPDGRRVGYVILRGLGEPHRAVELMRLAVTEQGTGFGREAVRLVKRVAFETLAAHRLWLDVMDHNGRARELYRSEGFMSEGRLRDSLWHQGRFITLEVMAVLEHDFRAERSRE